MDQIKFIDSLETNQGKGKQGTKTEAWIDIKKLHFNPMSTRP